MLTPIQRFRAQTQMLCSKTRHKTTNLVTREIDYPKCGFQGSAPNKNVRADCRILRQGYGIGNGHNPRPVATRVNNPLLALLAHGPQGIISNDNVDGVWILELEDGQVVSG